MIFLVSLETLTRGSYTLGFVEVKEKETVKKTKQTAQMAIVEKLASAGFPKDKIGIQVTDNTSLQIGIHTVLIVPINEFDGRMASTLTALL
jgi:hypothetical protein